jgi:hypothetical protein
MTKEMGGSLEDQVMKIYENAKREFGEKDPGWDFDSEIWSPRDKY